MVQFYWQQGAELKGKRLRLSFMARSEAPTSITVRCQQVKQPFGELGLSKACKLTTAWQKFSFDFKASPADAYTVPIFWFGTRATTISMGDLKLVTLP